MNKTTHILTHSNAILNKIYEKTKLINNFALLLCNILPEQYSKQCKIANIRENTIVIEVENSTWSINLRFKTSEIIKAFQKVEPSIKEIKWYIKKSIF